MSHGATVAFGLPPLMAAKEFFYGCDGACTLASKHTFNKRRLLMPKTKKSVAGAQNPATKSTSTSLNRFNLSLVYIGNAVTVCRIRLSNGAPRTVRDINDALPECIASYRIVWGESPNERMTVPKAVGATTVADIFEIGEALMGKPIPKGDSSIIYVN